VVADLGHAGDSIELALAAVRQELVELRRAIGSRPAVSLDEHQVAAVADAVMDRLPLAFEAERKAAAAAIDLAVGAVRQEVIELRLSIEKQSPVLKDEQLSAIADAVLARIYQAFEITTEVDESQP
jgi:hypothetical protein